jgi:serine transporter
VKINWAERLRQQVHGLAESLGNLFVESFHYLALFMVLTCWAVATFNPSILRMIETMGGPIIACLLFLMPMYAIRRVPSLRKYSGQVSNVFVVVIGLIALSAIVFSVLP